MLRAIFFVIVAALPCARSEQAFSEDSSWYFTANQIDAAYKYQEHFGRRLHRPLKPNDCFIGKNEFTGSFQGNTFPVPCRFILETVRHLRAMLENGSAKYLFPLDIDHGDLAVTAEVWEQKYRQRKTEEILPLLLQEPSLAVIYHPAEHLKITDDGSGETTVEATNWGSDRTVLGFYDGRPLQFIRRRSDGQSEPAGYRSFGTFHFLAHPLGELVFSVGGKQCIFDISFDDDLAVPLKPESGSSN
jgi:hypothetical protein